MKTDIKSLTTEEKIALAEQLWESIESERSSHLTPEQQALLEKRLIMHDKNPQAGKPWSEVKKKYFN